MDVLEAAGCHLIPTVMDRRGLNPVKDLKLYQGYRRLLRTQKPDMVITYTIKPNIYGGYAAKRCGIPYAANITGLGTAFQKPGMLRRLVTVMYKVALKKAKTVFFENQENRDVFVNLGIVPEGKCVLLHGAGVNLERFSLVPYPQESLATRFLFTGRVMAEKGVGELFSAMKRLVAEGRTCELHVLGDYEEDYKACIQTYEQEGWLHYHGFVQDVRPYIENCHCFVLPSWHEGMANVNLESAAMGRPLITSRIHGCMEAVVEGESGLLCERQNADSLYEAMKAFIDLPYEEKKAMGLVGRRHMEEVFDKRKVVQETVAGLGL
jgi:galacturonosyltransferase